MASQLDALAQARIKAGRQARRADEADRHKAEAAQLNTMLDDRDRREREQARKEGRSYDGTKHRIAEKDKQKARHRAEDDAREKSFSKEDEGIAKTGKVPSHYARVPEAAKIDQNGLTPKGRSEYGEVVRDVSNAAAKRHNEQQNPKKGLGRYTSDRMKEKNNEAEVAWHEENLRKGNEKLATVRRRDEARKGAA